MTFLLSAFVVAAGPGPGTAAARLEVVERCIDDPAEPGIAACRSALGWRVPPPAAALLQDLLVRKLASLGQWEAAVGAAREAVHARPQDPAAQLRLGEVLLYGTNRPEDATVPLREAIRLKPGEPRAHGSLGLALSALGRHGEAVAALEEALRLDPEYLEGRPASRAALEAARKGETWP